jgi:hypothetical protein
VLFLFELVAASVVSFGVLIALFSLCIFSYPLHSIMPTEQPSSDATDIFSLSDRVLADKLQFVKEVRFFLHLRVVSDASCIHLRLVLGTGVVFGYADQEYQMMPATLNLR